ncbi:unnamed protein product [Soboliphyme baturini]|uniref:Uncharacterized protein n=1 Tax=Soboliphyme baturini TaxID=241478 RepID=A0A183J6A3_9BILA|nr:unnamed protein product [Soboliphyme baturini]
MRRKPEVKFLVVYLGNAQRSVSSNVNMSTAKVNSKGQPMPTKVIGGHLVGFGQPVVRKSILLQTRYSPYGWNTD